MTMLSEGSDMDMLSEGFSGQQSLPIQGFSGQQLFPNQTIPFNYLDVSHSGQNRPGLVATSQAVPCAKNAGNEQKELSSNVSQSFGENIFLAKN